jgi:parallel beta-helix repeat protein
MKITLGCTFSCVVLAVFVGLSAQAFATNYAVVGSCTAPNPPTHPTEVYSTISAAVSSSLSVSGTIIEICPGNYPEQVVIGKKLTLEGVASPATQDAAVILPPSSGVVTNTTDVDNGNPIAAQVLVQSGVTVTLENLTVDGTGNQDTNCNNGDLQGILFQNASGIVNHVGVRNQLPGDTITGDQCGEGIYVQTAATFTSKVTIENSSVHNYNKNGITGNDAGTTLILTENYVQGLGLSSITAQNGIQLAFGATGTIVSQVVIDNIYSAPLSYAATDILLYDAAENSGVSVNSNVLGNSDLPIAIYTDTAGTYGDGVKVETNRIFGTSVYDAIDVCTNGNTVTGNIIVNSAESGVHLDGSCSGTGNSNTATGNTFIESYCAGVLEDPGTTGNTTTSETYYDTPFTITSSTASCNIPLTAQFARAFTSGKPRPKR